MATILQMVFLDQIAVFRFKFHRHLLSKANLAQASIGSDAQKQYAIIEPIMADLLTHIYIYVS